ncbi:MAG: ferredoxin reductase [Vulcanimicrobiaceae bacterium]
MARAALLGRVSWRLASVIALHDETPTARTLVLRVPGWPGHDAGQHVDVRLTAGDGYTAVRSYSIANAPEGDEIELMVEQLPDGEVSPYLARVAAVGDRVEVRGPVGGWFVWRPAQSEAVQLVAGGSGLVPLMAMIRTRDASGSRAQFRLLYSVRRPESVLYGTELEHRSAEKNGFAVTYAYTRVVPAGWAQLARRIDAKLIAAAAWPPNDSPTCYVCGPTAFVESVADLLTGAGHDPARIKTERFGPSGGSQ